MARARSADRSPPSLHKSLFTPGLYLWRMFVFLVLVGLLVAVLHQQLWAAMLNNLGLNVFAFDGERWRMVVHHGSPVARGFEPD